MKKILSVIIILSVFLASCLKDTTINSEGGLVSTPTIIEGKYSGLAYFGEASLLTAGQVDPMVTPMVINIAGRSALSSDLTVTMGVNDAARVAYNATSDIKFEAMPDSCYSFAVKTGVIPAGEYLDTLYITFFPEKIDPAKNYMLPISIKDAQGQTISGNFSTGYFHTIGNPLAGNYTWNFYRWNNATGTGSLSGASFLGDATLFLPVNPTMIQVPTGYFTQPNYQLSFTNTNGVYSNFKLAFNPDELKSLFTDNGITVLDGPNILLADPVAGHYKFQYMVFNGSANRYLIDEYIK